MLKPEVVTRCHSNTPNIFFEIRRVCTINTIHLLFEFPFINTYSNTICSRREHPVLTHWTRILSLLSLLCDSVIPCAFWSLVFFLCLLISWFGYNGLKHPPNISSSTHTPIQEPKRWKQRQEQSAHCYNRFLFFCFFFPIHSFYIHFHLKFLWCNISVFWLDLYNIAFIKFLRFSSHRNVTLSSCM